MTPDTPRPADPLTEEEIAALDLFIAARESVDPDVARDYIARGRATLDATRAPRSDDALRAAAQAVVSAWVDDESGMETFDHDLIDLLDNALAAYAPPSPDEAEATRAYAAGYSAGLSAPRSDDALRAAQIRVDQDFGAYGEMTTRYAPSEAGPIYEYAKRVLSDALATSAPPSPDVEGLDDAIAALDYAIGKLPRSGSRMTQAAERRVTEALDLLLALRESAPPSPDRFTDEGTYLDPKYQEPR